MVQWVADFGLPGPDRGEGGKYLFVPPNYKGECRAAALRPEDAHDPRHHARADLSQNNDPKPVVALIKKTLKIYPFFPGG